MASPVGLISAKVLKPEVVATDVASSADLVSVVMDAVVATATVTSSVAVYLLKWLVLVLLLLAIVEFLRCVLHFLLQTIVVLISLFLAVVVYVSTLFIEVATLLLADPLDKAVAWQQKAMMLMNAYLPTEC